MSTCYCDDLVVEGRDALAVYHFGDHSIDHYFGRTCGIYPFHDGAGKARVNLGCVDGLDVLGLPIRVIDGRSF